MERGQRANLNLFDDFFTQQQIDEILPPFDVNEEMRLIAELDSAYAESLND